MKRGHIGLIYLSVLLSALGFSFGLFAEVTTVNRGDEQTRNLRERNEIDRALIKALNRSSDILERTALDTAQSRAKNESRLEGRF